MIKSVINLEGVDFRKHFRPNHVKRFPFMSRNGGGAENDSKTDRGGKEIF